ncbi:deoxynucleotidyltransferase terminal-interacting protein 1 isoform X2 [Phyllopteryx taeniolatus]|uniref:deoxynucleotidyltransferase terminal-interacting protein 1 isoform X2 n=1 Tax=Phyllopteryx taeniolatus TaxID=161469 RepID=UPI002AD53DF9|nr:deoxynucleotidyltransferase terminal-interacting protein 1 isoform X2 [Phyllopteryx taeniolatus]
MEDKRTTNWPQPDGTQRKPNPFNLMIKHRHVHRRGRRSHVTVSYTDPQVSMDLLRAVLQPSFNNDIMAVFRKYHKFFEKAAQNVKENVGEDVHTDQLITEACRNVLEHAKVLFPESDVKKSTSEANVKRSRGSEDGCSQRGSPVPKKRKNRVSGAMASERSCNFATHVKAKCDAVKRDGPKWEPSRLSESSTFVLGSRANKALGMGGTRGRIYIKHADLFKYAADTKDKQWLAERHHMRATGGKMAYLLIEEDVQDLARGDEYRDCPDVKLDEMKPFSVPAWMVEKMQRLMAAQRGTEP